MQLSNYVLEKMGYAPPGEGSVLRASFCGYRVYTAMGIRVQEDSTLVRTWEVETKSGPRAVVLAFGNSLNRIFQRIAAVDFADDEEEWKTTRGAAPPFLVLRVGPTSAHEWSGWTQEDDGALRAWDGFPAARAEIASWGDEVAPAVLVSLAAALSNWNTIVAFRHVESLSLGCGPEGVNIIPMIAKMNASIEVHRRFGDDELQARFEHGMAAVVNVQGRVAKFLAQAQAERDELKRFLYLFFAFELQVHRVFSNIPESEFEQRGRVEPRLNRSLSLYAKQTKNAAKSLGDRFLWCALLRWPGVSDDDVDLFRKLKKVRNDLAHGTIEKPPSEICSRAEQLIYRLLSPGDPERFTRPND